MALGMQIFNSPLLGIGGETTSASFLSGSFVPRVDSNHRTRLRNSFGVFGGARRRYLSAGAPWFPLRCVRRRSERFRRACSVFVQYKARAAQRIPRSAFTIDVADVILPRASIAFANTDCKLIVPQSFCVAIHALLASIRFRIEVRAGSGH